MTPCHFLFWVAFVGWQVGLAGQQCIMRHAMYSNARRAMNNNVRHANCYEQQCEIFYGQHCETCCEQHCETCCVQQCETCCVQQCAALWDMLCTAIWVMLCTAMRDKLCTANMKHAMYSDADGCVEEKKVQPAARVFCIRSLRLCWNSGCFDFNGHISLHTKSHQDWLEN